MSDFRSWRARASRTRGSRSIRCAPQHTADISETEISRAAAVMSIATTASRTLQSGIAVEQRTLNGGDPPPVTDWLGLSTTSIDVTGLSAAGGCSHQKRDRQFTASLGPVKERGSRQRSAAQPATAPRLAANCMPASMRCSTMP